METQFARRTAAPPRRLDYPARSRGVAARAPQPVGLKNGFCVDAAATSMRHGRDKAASARRGVAATRSGYRTGRGRQLADPEERPQARVRREKQLVQEQQPEPEQVPALWTISGRRDRVTSSRSTATSPRPLLASSAGRGAAAASPRPLLAGAARPRWPRLRVGRAAAASPLALLARRRRDRLRRPLRPRTSASWRP